MNSMIFSLLIILLSAMQTATSNDCTKNVPQRIPDYGNGTVVDNLGGLKAYTSGSFGLSKRAIILVSDIYGFETPNLRALADKVAEKSAFYVVVPDFFFGDPMTEDSSRLPTWLQNHTTAKGFEDAKQVIAALKQKGAPAIGAAGFCWGGKVVVELAKIHDIKTAVLLHPFSITADDIKEVKTPIEILEGELDIEYNPPELVRQFEDALSAKPEVPSFLKVFSGFGQGFTLRYNVSDKEAVRKAEETHELMLLWLIKYVR